MTSKTLWIGNEYISYHEGQTGFLVEIRKDNHGGISSYSLCDYPPRTNESREPRLDGWCGTTDNVACYGRGVARVERLARNGRAFIRRLDGDESRAVLDELGYPELMPDRD